MNRDDRPDDQLVAAAKQGDERAMDQLLRRHYDRMHAVCSRIACGTRDADDATQEALLRVVRNIDQFDGRSAFSTWAYRIATNTALDELRKRNRRPILDAQVGFSNGDDDSRGRQPVDELAHLEVEAIADRMAIKEVLESLPQDFRLPVVMRDVGDLDYAEIAEALGIPIGTVKSRIARGRKILLEQLGNRSGPSERQNGDPQSEP